jgi:hypothetical protein
MPHLIDLIIQTILRNGINPNHVKLSLAVEMDWHFVLEATRKVRGTASIRALVIIINKYRCNKIRGQPSNTE